jgi:adenine-specific DNA-methyltransferase
LDWLTEAIQSQTGWTSFEGKTIADLFAGTGIVSYHFRQKGALVLSNDAEPYSAVIAHAMTRSAYTDTCKTQMEQIQRELENDAAVNHVGYITTHYTPYNGNSRQFFTVENGRRIDYVRARLDDARRTSVPQLSDDDAMFLLASLIVSADAVSNVPAVYGCYLKKFKTKAIKPFQFVPIHTLASQGHPNAQTFQNNVLNDNLLATVTADLVYLDPPYNERQYSKNYFPLNMIVKSPSQLEHEAPLKGVTGIPSDCFLSPFCRKGAVEDAFKRLFECLKAPWIVLSYNSESLVSKERMMHLMQRHGDVTVVERDYKRFKSFDYNQDKPIQEYLFFLRRRATTTQS